MSLALTRSHGRNIVQDATCQIKHTWKGHLDCLQRTKSRPAHDPWWLTVQQAPQGTALCQEELLCDPGPASEGGTILTSVFSAPPRYHRTPCHPGNQPLSTKTQQRNVLGGVILSLAHEIIYCKGKQGLLLVIQPREIKAMQKKDPWDTANHSKL